MSAEALIERARTVAGSLRIDTCTISRAGVSTFDPNTGQTTNTPSVIYTGECRLRMPTATESSSLFGGEDVTKQRFIIDIPDQVSAVALEDTAVLDASGDPEALTRVYRVVSLSSESFNFYRAVGVETVESAG